MSKHPTVTLGGVTLQKHSRDDARDAAILALPITRPVPFYGKDVIVSALRLEDVAAPFTLPTHG